MSPKPPEPEPLEAAGPPAELPSRGLLSFYDRLRARVEAAVAGGRASGAAAEALLLVPDVFVFLTRLALDRDVPASSRRLIGGALVYFVVPFDLLPEAVLGAGGYLDDLVLACAVLAAAFGDDLAPWAEKHWSGSRRLREVLADVSRGADSLLGEGLYRRLRGLLARRGIRI